MSTRDERGYTLIELSVVMSIFVIFISMATPFMFGQLNSAVRTESRVDVQQEARGALRLMVRELRQAKELYSTTEKPSGNTKLSFGVDLNSDGSINSYNANQLPLEQISYYLSEGTLFRARKQGQEQPLASGVSELAFTIYGSNPALDTNGDGIVTEGELDLNGNGSWDIQELPNVTRIGIAITVEDRDARQTYTAQAFLRNRTYG
jgi:prepilin-type N-terminal cleavage/methylation domain-containing protein